MTENEYSHRIRDLVHKTKEYDAAMELIAAALAGYPDAGTILDLRAAVYAERGEYEKALEDYEKTLALNPGHPKAAGKRDELRESRKKN
jgi:tetratricopeptide (TPR) repeat protein